MSTAHESDPQQPANTTDELIEMIPALRIYARNLMRGTDEVDDLVQETLMKALANVSSFQPGTNLRAWLFTIMRNSFLTRVVKRTREPVGNADCVSGTLVSFPKHDAHIAGNRVMAAIERLPPIPRGADPRVSDGESYQDVAEICGCAIGTVKSRINRARHMVIEDLGATRLDDLIAANY
ncbi:sigma-70 family RNA polymerase sigma factor [Gemmobacter lanyuensis]